MASGHRKNAAIGVTPRGSGSVRIGVISDTHGLLRPEAVAALKGVDRIVHAGDVGTISVLRALQAIAPVTAVRGNMDWGQATQRLPDTEVLETSGVTFYVLHDLEDLDLDPRTAGFNAVIYGHTHLPDARRKDGVLYLNPGSAGPIRGGKPVSLAIVNVEGGRLRERMVELL